MTVPALRFHFDFISPNAYLAWTQIHSLAARYDVAVEPVAVLFAGLLEASGQLGPAEIPAKIAWMSKSNLRKAARLGVALNPPAFHPFNPLLALRVVSLPLDPPVRRALVDALFQAVWVRSLHVSETAVVERVAGEIGLDGRALIDAAARPEAKERVRSQTDDAIARGVFGVPTMEIDGELFWGFDDFPQLEPVLAGNDPVDSNAWSRWAVAQRPSAVRPRTRRNP